MIFGSPLFNYVNAHFIQNKTYTLEFHRIIMNPFHVVRGRFFNFPVAVSHRAAESARSTSKYIHEAHTENIIPRGERNWTKSTSKLLLETGRIKKHTDVKTKSMWKISKHQRWSPGINNACDDNAFEERDSYWTCEPGVQSACWDLNKIIVNSGARVHG